MKGDQEVSVAYLDGIEVYSSGLPVGTTFDFDYTGTVQEITLPKGRYKLQCWGAQGGTNSYASSAVGSCGGYSEGVINLKNETTLYVFVGGTVQVKDTGALQNGGWNGGGGSTGYSAYGSTSGTSSTTGFGRSNPGAGGGATDISTVDSDMSYLGGRNNRSTASLLARCIVAGGGAGCSYYYVKWSYDDTQITTIINSTENTAQESSTSYFIGTGFVPVVGDTYQIVYVSDNSYTSARLECYTDSSASTSSLASGNPVVIPANCGYVYVRIRYSAPKYSVNYQVRRRHPIVSQKTNYDYGNGAQQGGGVNGCGEYPGTQSAGGVGNMANGIFGYGANQTFTNTRFVSGGGGGGWYGGGANGSSSTKYAINYSGGGSGFVNIPENAQYRPEGYTGLELESGTTIAGNQTFEAPGGGTETGHSGNGYARITVIK